MGRRSVTVRDHTHRLHTRHRVMSQARWPCGDRTTSSADVCPRHKSSYRASASARYVRHATSSAYPLVSLGSGVPSPGSCSRTSGRAVPPPASIFSSWRLLAGRERREHD
uniref:Uncharacterized protein n=2 Tax=unclassified Streptomyces TaxID=2593676 RepID=V9Z4L1_9ACTN|nr:hypothetical protein pFRL3_211c [Streptomyces sp. FR1]AHE39472.1 hypothetical protein pFRL4_239c [Streptomyces sp. F2]